MLVFPNIAAAALIAGLALTPQDSATTPHPASDTTNIEWFLPGNFEAAEKRAQESKRIILIKGISFGVDDAGAACATKGRW